MTTMPRNETIMPAICRALAFSRSRIHEHRMKKSGPAALMRTALIAVVLSSPR